MPINEVSDKSEFSRPPETNRLQAEQRLRQAQDVSPPNQQERFRYSDARLGGEVRTTTENEAGLTKLAVARVHCRDGSVDTVGAVRYRQELNEVHLQGDSMNASNYGVQDALLSEVSQNARQHGADTLHVWTPDGDTEAGKRWSSLGFQPEARTPDQPGQHWRRRI